MIKFRDSRESIVSELLLWRETPTQIAVKDTYELKVYPVTSLYNDGTINFDIPSQPKGLISNIDVISTIKVKNGDTALTVFGTVGGIFALWRLYRTITSKLDDQIHSYSIYPQFYPFSF